MSSFQGVARDEDPIDLNSVFAHQDGLRAAKSIVARLVWAGHTNTPVEGVFPLSASVPGPGDFSSEVADILSILGEILVFSENGEHTSSQMRYSSCNEYAEAPKAHECPPSKETFQQHTPSRFTNKPNSLDDFRDQAASTAPHALSNLNTLGISAVDPSSRNQGLESPYRVESPFSNNSVHAGSRTSSFPPSASASPFTLSGQRRDPGDVEDLAPLDSLCNTNRRAINNAINNPMDDTSAFSQSANNSGHPGQSQRVAPSSTAGRSLAKDSATIKSFLSVNKGREHVSKGKEATNAMVASHRFTPENRPIMPSKPATYTSHGVYRSTLIAPAPSHDTDSTDLTTVNRAIAPKKKRKAKEENDGPATKKKAEKAVQPKRISKAKEPKPTPAKYLLDENLWMRILEFTPPAFLRKARLISKTFKGMVDSYKSIYVNQRLENYGSEMPDPPPNITERQYNNLLGGKGCMDPNCADTQASRTHWSWMTRWCQPCWKSRIEREDRLLKLHQNQLTRTVITKILQCVPAGMHDSFMKPHDFLEDAESRPRGAPRLYKYYLVKNVEDTIKEYEALKAPPFKENPEHSQAEKAAALAEYQALEVECANKRTEFLEKRKEQNDLHMQQVIKIEAAVRARRQEVAKPYDYNRNARKKLFTKGAQEELPHIPIEFVTHCRSFKAAVRIFRDPGSERGWQVLKPKIQADWDSSEEKKEHARKEARVGASEGDVNTNDSAPAIEDKLPELRRSTLKDGPLSYGSTATAIAYHQRQMQQLSHQDHMTTGALAFSAQQRQPALNYPRTNAVGQFASTNFYSSSSNFPNFQYSNPSFSNSLLGHSASFQQNMAANAFGSSLNMSSSFPMNYPAFAMSHNSSTAQMNSRIPNTQIPINSLLNGPGPGSGPGPSVPQDYDWNMN